MATRADEIDYQIFGEEMQFVEIELDPGESAVAEAGMMMHKDPMITMDTVFGDGSSKPNGFMDALLGAGKRLLTGESLFTTVFSHTGGSGKAKVAFAAPYPGHILALRQLLGSGQRRVAGHILSEEDHDRPFWWRRLYHAIAGRRWHGVCPRRRVHHQERIGSGPRAPC
jgi:Mitochondrial biogenesis AIM24